MDVLVTVEGDDTDDLRSLWERVREDLPEAVAPVEMPPPPGAPSPVLEALSVDLTPDTTCAALATALITWVRDHPTPTTVTITDIEGRSLEVRSEHLKVLPDDRLRTEVTTLALALEERR
ncbi:hypothetical protein [Actinosynnema sp. NPDC020468]|uniref:effector-associated constant component EACC1 n=1 Tax=Actinosynnema sp. NPDC020468 TaxID=3154488 RepID=UPI0033D876CF